MALVLKEGKTYNPSLSEKTGVDMTNSNYYAVIDHTEYNKREKQAVILVDIYGSKELRESEGVIVDRMPISFLKDVFDEKLGKDGFDIKKAYELVASALTDWESDEV